jgi:Zn-dependent M28 family amino/carboxypeptidase
MLLRIVLILAVLLGLSGFALVRMTRLVDRGWKGPLGPLNEVETELSQKLAERVQFLSSTLGQHNAAKAGSLERATSYLVEELTHMDYEPQLESFSVRATQVSNVIVEITGVGSSTRTILVGAHYDSYLRSPSANSSCSGAAALLELLRLRAGAPLPCTLRVVFFANGEYPFTGTDGMGAAHHAREARARGDDLVVVICLDSVGAYSADPNSQRFPFPLNVVYPDTGDFLAAWCEPSARDTMLRFVDAWSAQARFPLEAGAMPAWFPGMTAGDQRPFAEAGFPALLLTDTGKLRYPLLRTAGDQPNRLDYARLARVVAGLEGTLRALAENR